MAAFAGMTAALPVGLQRLAHLEGIGQTIIDGRAETGHAMLGGFYNFAAPSVQARPETLFSRPPPNARFARLLYDFSWLDHLASLRSAEGRNHARLLVAEWIAHPARAREAAMPAIAARRLISWLRHTRLLLAGADGGFQKDFARHLAAEGKLLARRARRASGADLIAAGAGLLLVGEALGRRYFFHRGRWILEQELKRQILPDGGHRSRNPEAHLAVLLDLVLCRDALYARRASPLAGLAPAIDRMRPMLGFLAHGDGGRAVFHGGNEGSRMAAAALAAPSQANHHLPAFAPHSGFRRLTAGEVCVLVDCGNPPPAPYHFHSHASPLSFEMSCGNHRIITNCGAQAGIEGLRGAAAHSGLLLGEESPFAFSAKGAALGRGQCRQVKGKEKHRQQFKGWHDFYAARFGRIHERRLALHPDGRSLTGQDRLLPAAKSWWRFSRATALLPFSIIFHLHPDMLVAPAQEGGGVYLRPRGLAKSLWLFESHPLKVQLEDSLYCGGGGMRASQRLVLRGEVGDGRSDEAFIWRLRCMDANSKG